MNNLGRIADYYDSAAIVVMATCFSSHKINIRTCDQNSCSHDYIFMVMCLIYLPAQHSLQSLH